MATSAPSFDPAAEHAAVCDLMDEAEAWRRAPDRHLFAARPEVSAWSPAQHLYHAAQIGAGLLGWIVQQARLADASGDPSNEAAPREEDGGDGDGGVNKAGRAVLAAGRMPRGAGTSPDAFVPPDDLAPEQLTTMLATQRRYAEAMQPHLGALPHVRVRRTHPVFGALDAVQWLRFVRVHTDHHHRIVRDILAR